MFLHSGASLHGHEYSKRPPPANPQTGQRRSPLIRSAFATPRARSHTFAEDTKPTFRPGRPLSEYSPRTPEQVVRFQEPELQPEPEAPPTPMSEDEASYSASELSDASQATEKKSIVTARRRRRRLPRKSTTYLLAVPPPRLGPKTVLFQQIRPKLLLQLQQLSAECRPRPIIDVYPSSMIGSSVVALFSKKFPRIVGRRGKLSLDDIVLLKSEEYHAAAEDADNGGDGQDLDRRALIAVLSPLKAQDRAEVVLDDGSIWVATPLSNGNFDFVHEDEHGNTTTARWARRAVARPASMTACDQNGPLPPAPTSPLSTPEYRYTFSIINPLSRRHPVMASLTPTTLDIQNHYTTVSSSYGRYPPSRDFSRVMSGASAPNSQSAVGHPTPSNPPLQRNAVSDDEGDSAIGLPSPAPERTTIPIDYALKDMISVTAVWVALRSGWSPHYKVPSLDVATKADSSTNGVVNITATGTPTASAATIRRSTFHRSASTGTDTAELGMPGRLESPDSATYSSSTLVQSPITVNAGTSLPKKSQSAHLQTDSPDQRGNSPTPSLIPQCASGTTSSSAVSTSRTSTPRRATSTGAAFMQRRRQQQHASDASDSERPTPSQSLRRGKFPRVLSGDWGNASASAKDGSGVPTRRCERIPSLDIGREPPELAPSPAPPVSPVSPTDTSAKPGAPYPHAQDLGVAEPVVAKKKAPFGLGRRNSSGGGGGAGSGAGSGRRVQSAYYTTGPIKLGDGGVSTGTRAVEMDEAPEIGDLPPLQGLTHGIGSSGDHDEAGHKLGVAGRFRSFSNWFRRLGGMH